MKQDRQSPVRDIGGLHFIPAEGKNNPSPQTGKERRFGKSLLSWLYMTFSPFAGRKDEGKIVLVKRNVDAPLFASTILLIACGTVMIFSASYAYALSSYGESTYFLEKQGLYLLIGLGVAVIGFLIPVRVYEQLGPLYYGIICVALFLVLVIGKTGGGAQRWIRVPGTTLTIQPSEFMKHAIVFLLARYFVRFSEKIHAPKDRFERILYGIVYPAVPVAFALFLIVLEKHVSGLIIVAVISLAVMICGGVKKRWLLLLLVLGIVLMIVVIALYPHALSRVDGWLHIDDYYADADPAKNASVWQSYHGRNAVGSGGIFGLGFGESRLKHLFVSMPQNDFIFSIFAEETGFIGCIGVIGLFAFFVFRGFLIARRLTDPFMKLTAIGLTFKIGLQALLNMAVVTAMIPNTGVALPFFSYGGSALLAQMVEAGILLSLSRYASRPPEKEGPLSLPA